MVTTVNWLTRTAASRDVQRKPYTTLQSSQMRKETRRHIPDKENWHVPGKENMLTSDEGS